MKDEATIIRLEAIRELMKGLPAAELRNLSNEFDDLADEVAKAECEMNGHQIDNDHCGRPEHRFCRHCYERETAINEARQAKANEAADRKSAQPSESLGLGSKLFESVKGIFR